MAKLGAQITGIDAAEEVLKLARTHAKNNPDIKDGQITYIVSTIEDFCGQNKNKFDIVVASEIIEHVINPNLFLKCCVETLKVNKNNIKFIWIFNIFHIANKILLYYCIYYFYVK